MRRLSRAARPSCALESTTYSVSPSATKSNGFQKSELERAHYPGRADLNQRVVEWAWIGVDRRPALRDDVDIRRGGRPDRDRSDRR